MSSWGRSAPCGTRVLIAVCMVALGVALFAAMSLQPPARPEPVEQTEDGR